MKSISALLGLVVLAGMGTFYYWQVVIGGDDLVQFHTLVVARGDLLSAVSATGRIEPVEVVDVGAQVMGRIKSFGPVWGSPNQQIDYGSIVKQGQILVQIDEALLQGDVNQAVANLKLTKAQLQGAGAKLNQTKKDWERSQKLGSTISPAEAEEAEALYKVAQADVAIAEARIEQADAALEVAKINLGYTTITSPIDGVVIDRLVDIGQTVVSGLDSPSLFLLAKDLSQLQVWAAVSEADIGDIHLGQSVTFKVDAYRGKTFEGQVMQIRLNATTSHNVVTYAVIVSVENTDGKLLPYMTANLQFEVARRSDIILIASQALSWRPTLNQITPESRADFADQQSPDLNIPIEVVESMVWIKAADGLAFPVPVEIGISDLLSTEITGGELEPGMEVVVGTIEKAGADFGSQFIGKHRIMR